MTASPATRRVAKLTMTVLVSLAVLATAGVVPPVAAGPAPLAESVIVYDGFEGAFPGTAWTAADANATGGYDFWANSTARSSAGAKSLWAAGNGYRPQTDTLFFEDFESGALPAGWSAVDDDSANGVDTWGVSQYRVASGNYSVWTAQIGDNFDYDQCPEKDCDGWTATLAVTNNTAIHRYDTFMNATLSRSVNLAGYEFATINFWYWQSSELNKDYFSVIYWDQSQWNFLNRQSGGSGSWQQASVNIPGSATKVGFAFESDGRTTAEGVYVDDVTFTATRYINNSLVSLYDDGMDATLTRALSLDGYETARLEAMVWVQSEAGHDYLEVRYDDGGWQVADTMDGDSGGWQSLSVPLPATTTRIQFRFVADGALRMEGAYLDEVRVVGTVSPLTCLATASAAEGVEGETQFVYRVEVGGGLLPVTWLWDRGDGTSSDVSVQFVTYSGAGTYTASVTVRDAIGQTCTAEAPDVTVAHDLSSLAISPDYAQVTEGTSRAFVATDALGHELGLDWSVAPEACGEVHVGSSGGLFTASPDAGGTQCTVLAGTGGQTVSATVDVVHDLTSPAITPSAATVVEGQTATFQLLDTNGHGASGQWSATCGRLNADSGESVVFTALTTGGNTCTVRAELGSATVSAAAAVTHDVSELSLTPIERAVTEGGSVAFAIEDTFGHPVEAAWSVDPASCGAFTAGLGASSTLAVSADAGGQTCTVQARAGEATEHATVTVRHAVTSGAIEPTNGRVAERAALEFHVTDAHGHALAAAWSVSPSSCGAMEPAEGDHSSLVGHPEAGGSVCTVTAEASSLVLRATVGIDHGPAVQAAVEAGTLLAGGSVQATATLLDAAGHGVDAAGVSWKTTCGGGVSPAQGERTTVTAGADQGGSSCTLTASFGEAVVTVDLPVGRAGPFTVSIVHGSGTLQPGQSQQVTVSVRDASGNEVSPDAIEWTAPCGQIAGEGATVTYTAGEAAAGADCTVQATVLVGGTTATGTSAIGVSAGGDVGLIAGTGVAAAATAGAVAFMVFRRRRQP